VATDSGTERFVSGDGVATYVTPARRKQGPDLAGTGLDGTRISLADLRHGPVVVNVWGSWCAPCKAEQPALERVAAATRSQGVRFVGINVRDPSRTPALRHVTAYHVTYPSIYDPSSRLLTRFAIPARTIPTTYVLDRLGRVAAYVYGPTGERTLTALLDRVVAEPS
jgi:thiol-disulfide isomerase/thioredoxin